MALVQENIQYIHRLIKQSITESQEMMNTNIHFELDLHERTIRSEEKLKHQKELMLTRIAQIEKRFEQVEKRLEQIDKQLKK